MQYISLGTTFSANLRNMNVYPHAVLKTMQILVHKNLFTLAAMFAVG